MAEFIPVADIAECPIGKMLRVKVQGQRILLVHADSGLYAVDEMCTHEDVSLYLGCIKGDKIKCSLHGSYFDLKTGEPLEEPADEAIKTYAVKIDGTQVLLAK
jgi:3-phenylpropionate/trans-cinnamate dioxygenase ferredoxin subunit